MDAKLSLTERELYNCGAAMCAGSEHCRSEVLAKLLRGTDDRALCETVLNRLEKDKFIDESRYVRAFISDKLRFTRWGRRKIAQELWRKMIPAAVSQPLLEAIDEKLYMQVLRDLVRTKKKSIKAKNDYEYNMKLIRFAMGRGFEMQYIRRVLDVDDTCDFEEDGSDEII